MPAVVEMGVEVGDQDRGEALRRWGDMIRTVREQYYRSQALAAEAAGYLGENYWWRIENGQAENVSTKTLKAMDRALHRTEGTLEGWRTALFEGREPDISDGQLVPPEVENEIAELRGMVERLTSRVEILEEEKQPPEDRS